MAYQRGAFNIDRHLKWFIPHPTKFRNMQCKTGTIISGSNVVQFLDRTYYEGADLDIYVNPGHGREVGVHMIEQQGYRVVDRNADGGPVTLDTTASLRYVGIVAKGADDQALNSIYQQRSIHLVCYMEKANDAGQTLQVQIIVTADCVFHAIMNFHSSTWQYEETVMFLHILCSMRHEYHHIRQGRVALSAGHIRQTDQP